MTMSAMQQREWEDDLRVAGWAQDHGWWMHPELDGLYGLAAAARIFKTWVY